MKLNIRNTYQLSISKSLELLDVSAKIHQTEVKKHGDDYTPTSDISY